MLAKLILFLVVILDGLDSKKYSSNSRSFGNPESGSSTIVAAILKIEWIVAIPTSFAACGRNA